MHKKTKNKHIESELSDYFSQAKTLRCSAEMKRGLYQRIAQDAGKSRQLGWRPVMAFSFVCVFSLGLMFSTYEPQLDQPAPANFDSANKDMQIAMHYMEKIGLKTLSDVKTHGIMPAIVMPMSKTVAKI